MAAGRRVSRRNRHRRQRRAVRPGLGSMGQGARPVTSSRSCRSDPRATSAAVPASNRTRLRWRISPRTRPCPGQVEHGDRVREGGQVQEHRDGDDVDAQAPPAAGPDEQPDRDTARGRSRPPTGRRGRHRPAGSARPAAWAPRPADAVMLPTMRMAEPSSTRTGRAGRSGAGTIDDPAARLRPGS